MTLLELLDERARRLAQAHGHHVTDILPANHDTYIGRCAHCGACLIVRVRPELCGISGAACSRDCQAAKTAPVLLHTRPS